MKFKQETFNWREGNSPMERKLWKIARTEELVKDGIPRKLAEEQAEWEDEQEQEKRKATEEQARREAKGVDEALNLLKQLNNSIQESKKISLSPDEAAIKYGERLEYERARRAGMSIGEAWKRSREKSLSLETIRRWRKGLSPTFTDAKGEIRHVWPDDGTATAQEWDYLISNYVSISCKISREELYIFKEYDDNSQ